MECLTRYLMILRNYWYISSVQFSRSVLSDSLQPYEPQHTRTPCPSTNSWSPPKPMSTELVMPSNHLILCPPLLLLPSIFPSIRVFSIKAFKLIRLDLIEFLMNYGWRFMTLYRRQGARPSPRKRNAKKQNGCLSRPCKQL